MPPETLVPEPVSLKVEGREEGIIISWNLPKKNSDGSRLEDLAGFKLYKRTEVEGCASCPSDFPQYRDIDLDVHDGYRLKRERVIVYDEDVREGNRYLYKVAPYNLEGYTGELSDVASVEWKQPPPQVAGLEAAAGDRTVTLKWEPSSLQDLHGGDFAGYRIYRSQTSGSYDAGPVKMVESPESGYSDIGLNNNRQYFYVVRGVIKAGDAYIEGASSEEVLAIPEDMVPPDSPENLSAVPTANGISLAWDSVEDEDVEGYFIYRRVNKEAAMERVNVAPLQGNAYTDINVSPGIKYIYSVTAVDRSPRKNESGPSKEVAVTVPDDF